jgi:hypothetical protein
MATVLAPDPPPASARPVAPSLPGAPPPAVPAADRDVALDLLRGVALVVLVVNHIHLDSGLEWATEPFLSAAETLVAVSGVVVGMVFGRRWLTRGAQATTRLLLRRSFVLYRASVVVVALVGLLTLVPGLATEALTIAPRTTGPDLYAFDGVARTILAVVTLEAGPWQFNVLGFFVAALALAPAVLWALQRGLWPVALGASWALFLLGRATEIDVLPAQSEDRFPLLVWQLLFVHGVALGWHRRRLAALGPRVLRAVAATVLALASLAAYVRLHELGLSPFGMDPAAWRRWDAEHFDKVLLDAARLGSMVAFVAAAYLALRPLARFADRAPLAWLGSLGRASFYVFIVHVFVCLAVATALPGDGLGLAGNTAVQLAALALIMVMVRREALFRWIPR